MKKATSTRSRSNSRKNTKKGKPINKVKKTLTETKLNENVFIIFMIFMVFIVFMTYVIDGNRKEENIKNGVINAKEIFGELPKDFSDYNDNNVFGNTKVSRNVYYSMVLARKLELYKNGDITKEEYVKNVKKYNQLINK